MDATRGWVIKLERRWSRHHLDEHSLKFNFKTSNNQVEYETLLAGDMDLEVVAHQIVYHSDSQLVKHIPRKDNMQANMSSKLATSKVGQHQTTFHRIVKSPAIEEIEVLSTERTDQKWMTPIWDYLKKATTPNDKIEVAKSGEELVDI
ncbi:hypothetical protein CR513_11074, partial [Mucuna pruriens]